MRQRGTGRPQNTAPSYNVLKSTSESVFQLLCRASAHARSSLSFSWSVSVICFLITTALVRIACCCAMSAVRSIGSPTRTVSFCSKQEYCSLNKSTSRAQESCYHRSRDQIKFGRKRIYGCISKINFFKK